MSKYVVRYGAMRFLGIMSPRGDDTYARGTQVIARTDRGLECSIVMCEATEDIDQGIEEPDAGADSAGDDAGRFDGAIAHSGPAAR